jgi:predicted ATP-dependent serine protease
MTKTLKAPARSSVHDVGITETDIQIAGEIDIPDCFYNRLSSGIQLMDDLVGNFVPGSVFTVSAPRGVGKTTLLLQLAQGFQKATTNIRTLYISGEEHVSQLAFSCQRLGTTDVAVCNKSKVENILPLFGKFGVVIIDSLAAMTTDENIPKFDTEVWATGQFYKRAKETGTICFIIFHCTKEGKSKGNSSIEHMVDACVSITKMNEEDFGPGARNVEIDKNRFGSTGNISLRMTRSGWDFDSPIDDSQANNKDKSAMGNGGQRAEKKAREMQNLIDFMKERGSIKEVDLTGWSKLPSDPTGFDRTVRLLKGLVKMGKIAKVGDQFSVVP